MWYGYCVCKIKSNVYAKIQTQNIHNLDHVIAKYVTMSLFYILSDSLSSSSKLVLVVFSRRSPYPSSMDKNMSSALLCHLPPLLFFSHYALLARSRASFIQAEGCVITWILPVFFFFQEGNHTLSRKKIWLQTNLMPQNEV